MADAEIKSLLDARISRARANKLLIATADAAKVFAFMMLDYLA